MAAVFIATNANIQMPRTDTTRETYSNKLPYLLRRRTHLRQERESKLALVASSRTDLLRGTADGEVFVKWRLVRTTGTADREMKATLGELRSQEEELSDLDGEIASIQRLLKWFSYESPAPLVAH